MEKHLSEGCLWGRHPVLELLRGGGRRVDEVAVLSGASGPLAEVVALARRAGIKVSFRTRDQLTAIAGSTQHQGVVARVASAEYVDLDALLEVSTVRGEPAFLLALDQVQDPRNFGALLRTGDALGAHGVIVTKHHTVGLTGVVAKAAMGAVERVQVARQTNMVAALERLKKLGIWVYGGTASGGIAPWKVSLTGPVCLVVGSEGEGLRPLVARTCDALLTIPMIGPAVTLNVAAAAAALCYEVRRQRGPKPLDSTPPCQ
ncbi:MAG: 23S rRNA (guanosine(2251)-2'-O)-methyltransferase RlmB [Candidatus Rokuibacteriota bacterium]